MFLQAWWRCSKCWYDAMSWICIWKWAFEVNTKDFSCSFFLYPMFSELLCPFSAFCSLMCGFVVRWLCWFLLLFFLSPSVSYLFTCSFFLFHHFYHPSLQFEMEKQYFGFFCCSSSCLVFVLLCCKIINWEGCGILFIWALYERYKQTPPCSNER